MRKLSGLPKQLVYLYVLAMGVFHLYTASAGNYEAYLQRSIHLAFVLPLAFVLFPVNSKAPKDRVPFYDWLLAVLAAAPGVYSMVNYTAITERIQQIDPLTTAQLVLGSLLVLLLLEGTRRIVGLPLSLIAALFAVYMLYGYKLPGLLQGFPFSYPEVIEQLYLTDEGIFASPLGVSATYVMIFLIFGAFLEKSGAGDWFMSVAQAFTGTTPGGPAQIAVLSSCLFGSISGSAVANVYGTGTFTIPLMMKIGYEPFFAGAVEAVASSGGQIMPPIMGAGAFLMASFLGL
ncbi:MAG: TRAP transporter fused permease subunit, partial [Synergistaceae bacterium]|nr:TRAP transporter fused permease subunit [Synergistaceae bacterium]